VGALEDLGGQVHREGDDLGSPERGRSALVDVERAGAEDGAEMEGGEGVENDDLVGHVGVDGLVEREVRRVGVQLLEVGLALGGGDGRAEAVFIVERDVVEVCNEAGEESASEETVQIERELGIHS
jgi:hypothetical protein